MLERSYVTVDEGKLQTSYETLACAHRWSWLFACVDSTPSAFPCLINIWFIRERMFSCDYTHWQTLTGLRCGYKTWRRPQRPLHAWWLSTASMATSSSASKVLSFVYNRLLWNTMVELFTFLCSKDVMSVLLSTQCPTVCVTKGNKPASMCREINQVASYWLFISYSVPFVPSTRKSCVRVHVSVCVLQNVWKMMLTIATIQHISGLCCVKVVTHQVQGYNAICNLFAS